MILSNKKWAVRYLIPDEHGIGLEEMHIEEYRFKLFAVFEIYYVLYASPQGGTAKLYRIERNLNATE